MTREETKELIEVMQAWVNEDPDKIPQWANKEIPSFWYDFDEAITTSWNADAFVYRIKPKKVVKKVPLEEKNFPLDRLTWIKIDDEEKLPVVGIYSKGIRIHAYGSWSFEDLAKKESWQITNDGGKTWQLTYREVEENS